MLKIETVTVNKHEHMQAYRRNAHAHAKARVYFWPKGETIVQNLLERHARPYNEYRKLMDEVIARAGLDEWRKLERASWSQYAGCSCPCSPGFVLEGEGMRGFDIHVDVVEV